MSIPTRSIIFDLDGCKNEKFFDDSGQEYVLATGLNCWVRVGWGWKNITNLEEGAQAIVTVGKSYKLSGAGWGEEEDD